jgi:hypothetical protein
MHGQCQMCHSVEFKQQLQPFQPAIRPSLIARLD